MAKKGPAIQLQQEISTEEEWERLLEKEGLIVVDIYSDWCGPCSAMSAVLKKIKLEIGGDMLNLAMAKSDDIEALKRFRSKSEPTWMFLSNGKLINLMYGADSPKLQRLILAELKKEEACKQGLSERAGIEVWERFGIEVERYEEEQGKVQAMLERERAKKIKEEYERKTKECHNILEMMDSVGCCLIMPHAKIKYQEVLGDLLQEAGLMIKEREKVHITDKILEDLLFFCDDEPFSELLLEEMKSDDCFAILIKPQSSKEFEAPKIDKPLLNLIYGPMEKPPGTPGSPSRLLYKTEKQPSVVIEEQELVDDEEEDEEEEEEEGEVPVHVPKVIPIEIGENDLMGIWVPPKDKIRATCLKIFFTKYVSDALIAEPEPEPDHIAIVFEMFKKDDAHKIMDEYPKEIMRYGFFTNEDIEDTELVAKSFKRLELKETKRTYNEKLILQVSKKMSACVFEFAQLGPLYMSPNAEEGKRQCHLLFGENYDEPDIEDKVEEVVEPEEGKKKKKKKKVVKEDVEEVAEEEGQEVDEDEEHEGVIYGEDGEDEGEGFEDEYTDEEEYEGEGRPSVLVPEGPIEVDYGVIASAVPAAVEEPGAAAVEAPAVAEPPAGGAEAAVVEAVVVDAAVVDAGGAEEDEEEG